MTDSGPHGVSHRPQTATHWGVYVPTVIDDRVTEIQPHPADPEPSEIGQSLAGSEADAVRIRQPMIRAGYLEHGPRRHHNARGREPFVAVDWDTALDRVARAIDDVKARVGNAGIFGGSYGWASAGRFHHAQSQIHRFLNAAGGYVRSVNTYSHAAMEVIVPRVLCSIEDLFAGMPSWTEIAAHTELLLAFGGLAQKNAQVNSGGVGRHSVRKQQRVCREAGVRFVNISPIREDITESLSAEWLAARPGTDVAIMLGLAHTLVTENLYDRDFIANCCVGFERFLPYLLGREDGCAKSAAWAARISGLSASRIESLAREIADHRTLITASWSVQRQDHGEQPYWMAIVLAALSGSLGKPGGGFGAGYGAEQAVGNITRRARIAALPQGTNRIEEFIPVARITDLLTSPGQPFDYNGQRRLYPDIRLIYWCGGNPFHHHQDLNRLVAAWQEPETIIVHEPWWNSLARHADIVLPVTTSLERNDISCGLHDQVMVASRQAIEPVGEARDDYDIFSAIAQRMGFGETFTEGRSSADWIMWLYGETQRRAKSDGIELPAFADFWRQGWVDFPRPASQPTLCAALRADPLQSPLATPSGRVEIYSEVIAGFGYDDCLGHPTWMEPSEWLGSPTASRFPLHLISNQPRTRLHSQYDNGIVSRNSKIHGREPLIMHPADAAARGLQSGDLVRVFNGRGSCLCGLILSEDILPRVVQLATGAWFDPLDSTDRYTMCVHGNPNVLTRDAGTSRLAQGPSAMTTLVQVERFKGSVPPVKVFHPPAIEQAGPPSP